MSHIPSLIKELELEAQTSRKMLERVPDSHYDWKPHEKSMTIRSLATHIAELPTWVEMVLDTQELDFAANPYTPKLIHRTEELLHYFEASLLAGKNRLKKAKEQELSENWTLRTGEIIHVVSSKAEVIRMTYCQIVHHRAQLGVYLRLLNIPIPGSYGPSADEVEMQKESAIV